MVGLVETVAAAKGLPALVELALLQRKAITGRLLNWSLSDDITRLLIPIGIAYGSDVMLAMKLAED